MAHKKAGGSAKNVAYDNPKYLGIKLYAGEKAQSGSIIVRQRGTRIMPGTNVKVGKDHTLYSVKEGKVVYSSRRKTNFDNSVSVKKVVSVK
jgi:large subunit ribosomal protein L27